MRLDDLFVNIDEKYLYDSYLFDLPGNLDIFTSFAEAGIACKMGDVVISLSKAIDMVAESNRSAK